MTIVSLFDRSGNALRPWAARGHTCLAFDLLNDDRVENYSGGGSIRYIKRDLRSLYLYRSVSFLMGWPPCDDLAVSGAKHFETKRQADPDFQKKALALAMQIPRWGKELNVPWMFENPVSALASLYRKPDHYFHPYEYGGYLPADDVHPRFPAYIAPRDAYPKKTCIWSGNGFIMPDKQPVPCPEGFSTQFKKLGGKSARTKQIRSEGPRGFLEAVYQANKGLVK